MKCYHVIHHISVDWVGEWDVVVGVFSDLDAAEIIAAELNDAVENSNRDSFYVEDWEIKQIDSLEQVNEMAQLIKKERL